MNHRLHTARRGRSAARSVAALVGLGAALAAASGCVPYRTAQTGDDARFEHLWRRDLPRFEQRLASEHQRGTEDAWTRVGQDWLALINCEPIEAGALGDDAPLDARLVRASLILEDRRRRRLLYERGMGLRRRSISRTLLARFDDTGYFERSPEPHGDDKIEWPAEDEDWADELPAARTIDSQCGDLYNELLTAGRAERQALEEERAAGPTRPDPTEGRRFDERTAPGSREDDSSRRAPGPDDGDADDGGATSSKSEASNRNASKRGSGDVQRGDIQRGEDEEGEEKLDRLAHQRREFEALTRVLRLGDELPAPQRRGSLMRMLWLARYHGARLSVGRASIVRRLAEPDEPLRPDDRAEIARWYARATTYLEPLVERLDAPEVREAVADERRGRAVFLHGLLQLEREEMAAALASFGRAERLDVGPENRWKLRYLRLRLLEDAARWEDAVAYADALPPRTSELFSPYAYRAGLALDRAGAEDRFLDHVMSVFRDRPYRADPFMRALYARMLRQLADYVFDKRILEILEDMGPRSTTFERVEAYASIALDRGRPNNATAAASWLLAENENHQYHPRYHALLALAAFLRDEPRAFVEHLEDVRARSEELHRAIPERRRPSFFAEADAQFARILRQMLPVMAEWGASKKARARRQRWLKIIVERTQRFVRSSPKSLARPALVELYRLASALLEDHPRNYPERVGRSEPLPLVLGTVRVDARDLRQHEPRIRPTLPPLYSLTLLPRDERPPHRWPDAWDDARRDADEGRDADRRRTRDDSDAAADEAGREEDR